MKVVDVKNITKKEGLVHYREEYSGEAVFQTFGRRHIEKKIQFILERTAMGNFDIRVDVLEDLDYPLIPVVRHLKDYIAHLQKTGKLP